MVSVLHVLLTILKILGIAILIILAILLAVLLLVLFVPVRYKAKGNFEGKNIDANANVSWLFNFLHLRAGYKYSEPFHLQFKILGIPLIDNLREKKPKKEKNKNKTEIAREEDDKYEPIIQDKPVDKNSENKTITETKLFTETDENSIKERKNVISEKISSITCKINSTYRKIHDTAIDVTNNIEYYVKLVNQERTKAAFELCKKQIFKLLKLLCPRKYRINLHLGFEDPSTMGEVLAIWGMLYPFHMGKIDIKPEFETAVMEGDFIIKGRICIVSILKAACILYFNKNIKLLIKRLKRETNNKSMEV
jgi:hypothetical protein